MNGGRRRETLRQFRQASCKAMESASLDYAVWVSPENEVYWVPESHVAWACDHPERCGMTEDALRAVYARFGEPWREDGTAAREEIVRDLVGRGWIRLRRYRNGWSYSTNRSVEAEARLRSFLALVTETSVHGYQETDRPVAVYREGSFKDVRLETLLAEPFERIPLVIVRPKETPLKKATGEEGIR